MQGTHHGHHHRPSRLTRLLALSAVAFVGLPTAVAEAAHSLALPSPIAPLSVTPPLSGGATASAEARRHRVSTSTTVRVAVDPTGAPVRVQATQRLTLRLVGDYFYSIGAPLTAVQMAPGSDRAPGLRAAAILWQGFNPGTRVLAATAELEPGPAAAGLPLRIHVTATGVVLENTTRVSVAAYRADVARRGVDSFLASLRSALITGAPPAGASVSTTSAITQTRVTVSCPLRITGTIGTRRVDVLLGGSGRPVRATFPNGQVHLRVDPEPPRELLGSTSALAGAALLRRAVLASLEYARWTQYEQYLGNPDPSGVSHTAYLYASGERAAATPVAVPSGTRGSSLQWWLVLAAALALGTGAVFAWARA